MATGSTRREEEKFMLRLPSGMRGRLAEKAKVNTRSTNSEIVHRLDQVERYEEALARANMIIDTLLKRKPGDTHTLETH